MRLHHLHSVDAGRGLLAHPLPEERELGPEWSTDGGTWWHPVRYDEIAHFLIPSRFNTENSYYDEAKQSGVFQQWVHHQDIDGLSALLKDAGIEHQLSDVALEIKRF